MNNQNFPEDRPTQRPGPGKTTPQKSSSKAPRASVPKPHVTRKSLKGALQSPSSTQPSSRPSPTQDITAPHSVSLGTRTYSIQTARRVIFVILIAALTGGIITAIYAQTYERFNPNARMGNFVKGVQQPSFVEVNRGDCVNWDTSNTGILSNFKVVNCSSPHRFEVASATNLSAYPSSEFGPNASYPGVQRQIQLSQEICQSPTIEYLKGSYDPSGRFRITPILPPPVDWEKGDRTLLCGVTAPDKDGISQPFQGRATEQDQASVEDPGVCMSNFNGGLTNTDCALPHILEITSIVDLGAQFREGFPNQAQQDEFLSGQCAVAAMDYLGGDDALYNSTLIPFWNTIDQQAWNAESRKVNCSILKPIKNPDDSVTFAELTGSARGEFRINGELPPPQPERRPRKEDA